MFQCCEFLTQDTRSCCTTQFWPNGINNLAGLCNTFYAVEKIAEGILRLATMAKQAKGHAGRRYKHRFILESLDGASDVEAQYLKFLADVVARQVDFTEDLWEAQWKSAVHSIANSICGVSLDGTEVEEFLSWKQVAQVTAEGTKPRSHSENIYPYRQGDREVGIKVGSIHSVKSQTHTGTLVLETAWNGPNLEQIITWLSGESRGHSKKDGIRIETRLKTHYVAMTRQSHLLCLALHKQSLLDSKGKPNQGLVNKLKQRGWEIVGI
jgi:DNA helicase II / ATP-dependent DNA helicase PcrA